MPFDETKFVCADCFDDPTLKEVISGGVVAHSCSYCGSSSEVKIASRITDVAGHIRECIDREYTDPANELPYESREGGYQGAVYDTDELLFEIIGIELTFEDDDLREDLVKLVDPEDINAWCERDFFGSNPGETLLFNWQSFCQLIKHSRRFFFNDVSPSPHSVGEFAPRDLLARIQEVVEEFGLIATLGPNTPIYRVRFSGPGEAYSTPAELGPPPQERVLQANRMNPPGVSMFYGAESLETALKETASGPGFCSIGRWRLLSDINILDFSRLPEPVPFFDNSEIGDARHFVEFLHQFVSEISKPVARDQSTAHLDYLPTQVFTEFVRYAAFNGDGSRVHGIRYPSSANPGTHSLVLFFTLENVRDGGLDPWFMEQETIELRGCRQFSVSEELWESWRNDAHYDDWNDQR